MPPKRRRGPWTPSADPKRSGYSLDSHELFPRRPSIKTSLAENRGVSVDTYLTTLEETKSMPSQDSRCGIIPAITCELVEDTTSSLRRKLQHSHSTRSMSRPRPQMRRVSLHSFRDPSSSFTRPSSPISIDMSRIPSRLAHLQRSPDHIEPAQTVWDSSLSGTYTKEGFRSSSGIILTDIALNQTPDPVLSSPNLSQALNKNSSSSKYHHTKHDHDHTRKAYKRRSLFRRITTQIMKRITCGSSKQHQVNVSLEDSVQSSSSSENDEDDKDLEDDASVKKQELLRTYSHTVESMEPTIIPANLPKILSSKKTQLLRTLLEKETQEHQCADITLLDLQREKENKELLPSRYIEDIKVLHNIHRREVVSKLLYREEGQLFYRRGTSKDPNPPLPRSFLLAGPTSPPPLKRNLNIDPLVTSEDRKTVLEKIMGHKLKMSSSFESKKTPSYKDDTYFRESCLRAHNLYRARHFAPPLALSPRLCISAQFWANRLAQTGHLFYRRNSTVGENLFCRNVAFSSVPDVSGDEVAAYWYSDVRRYRFNLRNTDLQAHAGSFSQMIWMSTKLFGIGKALSREGKLIIVAHYFPTGNLPGNFRLNVNPLSTRALAKEMMTQGKALLDESFVEQERINRMARQTSIQKVVSGVLAAQPPNIIGRNATKILAAHMLGHAACVVATHDDKLDVLIYPRTKSKLKRKKSVSIRTNAEFQPVQYKPQKSKYFPKTNKLTRSTSLVDLRRLSSSSQNRRKSFAVKSQTSEPKPKLRKLERGTRVDDDTEYCYGDRLNIPSASMKLSFNNEPLSRRYPHTLVRSKAIFDNPEAFPSIDRSSISSYDTSYNNCTSHLTSSEGYLESSLSKCSFSPSSMSSSSSGTILPEKCVLRRIRFQDEANVDFQDSSESEAGHCLLKMRPQIRLPYTSQSSAGYLNELALSPLRY